MSARDAAPRGAEGGERTRLIGRPTLVAFVITLAAALFMLLPSAHELEVLSLSTEPSELSLQHLRALSAANPSDLRLRLLLARGLFATGDVEGAALALHEVMHAEGEIGTEARRFAMTIAIVRFRAKVPGVDVPHVEDTLRHALDDALDQAALEEAAKIALEIGKPRLAAEVYERLARADPSRRGQWLAEAARWYRALGDETRASALYVAAADSVSDPARKLEWATFAIDAAARAGNPKAAHELSERFLERMPKAPALVTRALQHAVATNQTARARELGRILVAEPDQNDPAIIEAQIERELAAGDFAAALFLLERLVKLRPESVRVHARMAQVADAMGQRTIAYREYRWLLDHGHDDGALERAIALARASYDVKGLFVLLERRARRPNATDAHVLELAQGYEDLGDPAGAARVLRERLALSPRARALWRRLAILDDQRGAPNDAVGDWRKVGEIAPLDGDEAVLAASIQWRLDEPRDALATVLAVREDAPGRGVPYWSLVADLAWELNESAAALRALRELRSRGDRSIGLYQRMVAILQADGRDAEAGSVAAEAFTIGGDARMLFLAADLYEKAGKDKELVAIFGSAAAKFPKVRTLEEYWTRRAAALQRLGRLEEACLAYDEALRIQPSSVAMYGAALACAVEREDRVAIERHVARWSSRIDKTPELYTTYSLALLRLHRDREAVGYMLRHLKEAPNDYLVLLELADAVERLGDYSHAYRVRRHALLKVWPHALAALRSPRTDEKARQALLARAILARKLEGPDASYKWLERLVPKGDGPIEDAQAADLAVSYYLADGNTDLAKRVLMKQRASRPESDRKARLTLALLDNNIGEIERLLTPDVTGAESYDSSRIDALIRTGHDAEAMNAIDAAIQASSIEIDRNTIADLRGERADLAERIAPTARAGYALDSYGPLFVHGPSVSGLVYRSKVQVEVEGQRNELGTSGSQLPLGSFAEYQARVGARYRSLRTNTRLTLGANVRADAAAPQASVSHAHQLLDRLAVKGELALQHVPVDTPLIRAAGVRDSAAVEVGVALTQRDRVEVTGTAFQERTIRRDGLDRGGITTLTVSHKILHSSPEWSVLASGLLLARSLDPNAAAALAKLGLPAGTSPEELLHDFAAMATVGTRIENGDPTSPWGRASFPRYSAAVNVGRLFTDDVFSVELRGAVGTRVFGDDLLGISGYYARGLAASGEDAFAGASVTYAHGIGL